MGKKRGKKGNKTFTSNSQRKKNRQKGSPHQNRRKSELDSSTKSKRLAFHSPDKPPASNASRKTTEYRKKILPKNFKRKRVSKKKPSTSIKRNRRSKSKFEQLRVLSLNSCKMTVEKYISIKETMIIQNLHLTCLQGTRTIQHHTHFPIPGLEGYQVVAHGNGIGDSKGVACVMSPVMVQAYIRAGSKFRTFGNGEQLGRWMMVLLNVRKDFNLALVIGYAPDKKFTVQTLNWVKLMPQVVEQSKRWNATIMLCTDSNSRRKATPEGTSTGTMGPYGYKGYRKSNKEGARLLQYLDNADLIEVSSFYPQPPLMEGEVPSTGTFRVVRGKGAAQTIHYTKPDMVAIREVDREKILFSRIMTSQESRGLPSPNDHIGILTQWRLVPQKDKPRSKRSSGTYVPFDLLFPNKQRTAAEEQDAITTQATFTAAVKEQRLKEIQQGRYPAEGKDSMQNFPSAYPSFLKQLNAGEKSIVCDLPDIKTYPEYQEGSEFSQALTADNMASRKLKEHRDRNRPRVITKVAWQQTTNSLRKTAQEAWQRKDRLSRKLKIMRFQDLSKKMASTKSNQLLQHFRSARDTTLPGKKNGKAGYIELNDKKGNRLLTNKAVAAAVKAHIEAISGVAGSGDLEYVRNNAVQFPPWNVSIPDIYAAAQGEITVLEMKRAFSEVKMGKTSKGGRSELAKYMVEQRPIYVEELHGMVMDHLSGECHIPELNISDMIGIPKSKGACLKTSDRRYLYMVELLKKIIDKIQLDRIAKAIQKFAPQSLQGFIADRSSDMLVYTLVRMAQQRKEAGLATYVALADVQKAFPSIDRLVMYECLEKFGVPEKLVSWIILAHQNTLVRVKQNGIQMEMNTYRGGSMGSTLMPALYNITMIVFHATFQKLYPQFAKMKLHVKKGSPFIVTNRVHKMHDEQQHTIDAHQLIFADDVVGALESTEMTQQYYQLTDELQSKWGNMQHADGSSKKTAGLAIMRKRETFDKCNFPTMEVGSGTVNWFEILRYLGINIDSQLNFLRDISIKAHSLTTKFNGKPCLVNQELDLNERLTIFEEEVRASGMTGNIVWQEGCMTEIIAAYEQCIMRMLGISKKHLKKDSQALNALMEEHQIPTYESISRVDYLRFIARALKEKSHTEVRLGRYAVLGFLDLSKHLKKSSNKGSPKTKPTPLDRKLINSLCELAEILLEQGHEEEWKIGNMTFSPVQLHSILTDYLIEGTVRKGKNMRCPFCHKEGTFGGIANPGLPFQQVNRYHNHITYDCNFNRLLKSNPVSFVTRLRNKYSNSYLGERIKFTMSGMSASRQQFLLRSLKNNIYAGVGGWTCEELNGTMINLLIDGNRKVISGHVDNKTVDDQGEWWTWIDLLTGPAPFVKQLLSFVPEDLRF